MKYIVLLIFVYLLLPSCKAPLTEYKFETILWAADWSPDGQYIATGGNTGVLKILTAEDYSTVERHAFPETITKVKWHPSAPILAVSQQSTSPESVLIDMDSKRKTPLPGISPEGARGLAWSPDGSYLAVGDNEGYVSLYTPAGELKRRVKVDPKAITDLSWHPNGSSLVTVGSKLGFYNPDKEAVSIQAHRAKDVLMLSVAWHPSGELFAIGDYGDYSKDYPPLLQYWGANGQLLWESRKSRAEYRNLSWSPDGKTLASASDGIRLWNKEGKLLRHVTNNEYIWGVAWHPEGERLVATTGTGKTLFFNRRLENIRATD